MGYVIVDPDEVEPTEGRPCVQRALGDRAGLQNVAINRYEADPGEQLPLAYHYHDDQEEVFLVLDGELHVETPEADYRARAGQCFVAEPDSPHRAYNPADADDPVRVFAVGAPSVDDAHPYEP